MCTHFKNFSSFEQFIQKVRATSLPKNYFILCTDLESLSVAKFKIYASFKFLWYEFEL